MVSQTDTCVKEAEALNMMEEGLVCLFVVHDRIGEIHCLGFFFFWLITFLNKKPLSICVNAEHK